MVAAARSILLAVVCALVCAAPTAAGLPVPAPNPVQAENALPGTTAWLVQAGGDIEVYASQISAVSATSSTSMSAPRTDTGSPSTGSAGTAAPVRAWSAARPAAAPTSRAARRGRRSGAEPIRAGWPVTDTMRVGGDWTSGYYLAEAVLTSGPWVGRVATTFFVVHPPAQTPGSSVLVQVPVNTWEAYNAWGGKSLYDFFPPRAYAVSFDRPFGLMAQSPMWWEIQLVRFLEREGYDVSYQTDVDTDLDGASLLRHRLVMVAGHDEYWSGAMRDAFDTALADGTNLAFMGSNDGYWQVKYADGDRTIVSAKSLSDPNPVLAEKTAMFREIGRPECELMGVQHQFLRVLPHALDYTVTPAGAADPWLAGTGFNAGDTVAGVVGREHDVINPYPMSCFHPGLTTLFHYDGGGVDQNGDAVRFTAPSGARVFASGAQQFTWALDDWRSDGSLFPEPPIQPWRGVPVDPRLQQFMREHARRPHPAGRAGRAHHPDRQPSTHCLGHAFHGPAHARVRRRSPCRRPLGAPLPRHLALRGTRAARLRAGHGRRRRRRPLAQTLGRRLRSRSAITTPHEPLPGERQPRARASTSKDKLREQAPRPRLRRGG